MRETACAVPHCRQWYNEATKGSFYTFPRNAERLEQWRAACGLQKATKHHVVCELHFSEDSFNPEPSKGSKGLLRRTAVPNQHLTLINHDENAGCASPPRKRRALMDIPAPGQIPEPSHAVAVEGLE